VKDPKAPQTLYVEALAAPETIDTMPEKTLLAYAKEGKVGAALPPDGGDAEKVLARFAEAGIDVEALARQLQTEGAQSFVKSWKELMQSLLDKGKTLAAAS
jgi:transaldolase